MSRTAQLVARSTLLIQALIATALIAQPPASDAPDTGAVGFTLDDVPAVVARVNGEDVNKEELVSEAQDAYEQLAELGDVRVMDRDFYREALDQIIAGRLLVSEAQKAGVAATEPEIEEELARIKGQYPSEDVYLSNLARQGISEADLRDNIQLQVSIGKYVATQVQPSITITEEEMRAFYDRNLEAMPLVQEAVRTRHILVSLDTEADEETTLAAREKAQGILTRARGGEDFAALAQETSDDETAAQGGELPWLQRGQSLEQFESAAFALQPGQLSDVVQSAVGFHIILCLERRDEHRAEFDEVRQQIERSIRQQRVGVAVIERVKNLEVQAGVERFL